LTGAELAAQISSKDQLKFDLDFGKAESRLLLGQWDQAEQDCETLHTIAGTKLNTANVFRLQSELAAAKSCDYLG
ncbi:hypothetical protein ACSTIP_00100, partial [Vibrio parahaemolyticus]